MAKAEISSPVYPEVTIILTMKEALALYHLSENSCDIDEKKAGLPDFYILLEPLVRDYVPKFLGHDFFIKE